MLDVLPKETKAVKESIKLTNFLYFSFNKKLTKITLLPVDCNDFWLFPNGHLWKEIRKPQTNYYDLLQQPALYFLSSWIDIDCCLSVYYKTETGPA
jgi:hypothetical protein